MHAYKQQKPNVAIKKCTSLSSHTMYRLEAKMAQWSTTKSNPKDDHEFKLYTKKSRIWCHNHCTLKRSITGAQKPTVIPAAQPAKRHIFKLMSGLRTMKIDKLNTKPKRHMAITRPMNSNDIVSTRTEGMDREYVTRIESDSTIVVIPKPMSNMSKRAHRLLQWSKKSLWYL